ncbi:MAG TPA: YdeI/OmpD-associated family protein [Terriglobales bacterium]|nr:YdeI/OmpD-associated family protein [Terriglobales bacterium]
MSMAAVRTFSTTLERTGDRLHWVVIRIPFNAAKLWGRRGQIKVKGEISAAGGGGTGSARSFAFRTSLFPDGKGRHFMMVNKEMQKGAGVKPGMTARFRMEPDTEVRTVTTPPELERVLRESKRLRKFYESLNYSTRREIAKWIAQAKHSQTRRRRSERLAVRLMETMEAERELPPMIEAALARNPKAREGWQRMTPAQRRADLLSILYYRDPESRALRIAKAVERMLENTKGQGGHGSTRMNTDND